MTDKEIIEKRIIKGLRYCENEYPPCAHCPYRISGLNLCKKHLIGDAYYLVKTQQAEIERLKTEKDNLIKTYHECQVDNIKEFAERLKATFPPREDARCTLDDCYTLDCIDNIMAEMVGDENARP